MPIVEVSNDRKTASENTAPKVEHIVFGSHARTLKEADLKVSLHFPKMAGSDHCLSPLERRSNTEPRLEAIQLRPQHVKECAARQPDQVDLVDPGAGAALVPA